MKKKANLTLLFSILILLSGVFYLGCWTGIELDLKYGIEDSVNDNFYHAVSSIRVLLLVQFLSVLGLLAGVIGLILSLQKK